jgi:hypothetical protein
MLLPLDIADSAEQLSNLEHALQRLATQGSCYADFYACVRAQRWSRVLASRWRKPEHINALELRAALLALHWLLSYPSALGRRVYLLVDSTVALFSLCKGRSSAPDLLLVLRKISALLLASGVSILPGWLPSAVNPADAASRLRPEPPSA